MSAAHELAVSPAPSAGPAARRRAGLGGADAAMLAVCLVWGANFAVVKLALARMEPLAFTALRFVAASLLLLLVLQWREGGALRMPAGMPAGSRRRLLALGLLGNTFYQIAFSIGLARTTATNSALIIAAVPAVIAVLGGVLGLERTTARMRAGILLGVAGVAVVVLANGSASGGAALEARTLPGDLLTLAAVVCWALYTLLLPGVPHSLSPLRVTALTTVLGTPGLVLAGLPALGRVAWGRVGWQVWAAMGYAAVLSVVVASLLWIFSVRAIGGTRTAIYMCVTPVVAALVAWAALGEAPGLRHVAGAAAILAGVLLTRR